MKKISIIIIREYVSRVNKKSFILTTFLTPLFLIGIVAFTTYLSVKDIDKDVRKVIIKDEFNILQNQIKNSSTINFEFKQDIDSNNFAIAGFTDIIYLYYEKLNTQYHYNIISAKKLNLISEEKIAHQIKQSIESNLLNEAGIKKSILDSIHNKISSLQYTVYNNNDSKVQKSNVGMAYSIGYISGFLIYLTLLIYGTMVMRGVTEEKTNRISEVIISSVKPFQLMLGKIIGIGAVGLTQFLMWIILLIVFFYAGVHFLPNSIHLELNSLQNSSQIVQQNQMNISETTKNIYQIQHSIQSVNWFLIIGFFIFYFLGGYLFYATLFAAVGSAVGDDPQDSQSLMMPITMPIILSFIIMTQCVQLPNSSMSFWASIIPFSSPLVMMSRIAYGIPIGVPYWQILISMIALILGIIITTWISAKIYRTGILLYGKKNSIKEVLKWIVKK